MGRAEIGLRVIKRPLRYIVTYIRRDSRSSRTALSSQCGGLTLSLPDRATPTNQYALAHSIVFELI